MRGIRLAVCTLGHTGEKRPFTRLVKIGSVSALAYGQMWWFSGIVCCMKPETQTPERPAPDARQSQHSHPETTLLSIGQTAQLSGVSEADLLGLVECGALTPATPGNGSRTFDISCVMKLQRAALVRQDLALDSHGFAMALMLLDQLIKLEVQLHSAHCNGHHDCNLGDAHIM